jgi:Tfp pilus assembly protein PilV
MKSTRSHRGRSRRGGFTIVELIVAVVVMVIGVMGLASTAAVVSRLIGGGAHQATAATVAQSRFESLRSVRCAAIVSGSATTRKVRERWVTELMAPRYYRVVDTVRFDTPKGERAQAYRSYIRCTP